MSALQMYRGDYIAFRGVAIINDDLDIFDLTGSKVYFTAKNAKSDADSSAVISLDSEAGGVDIPDPLTGEFFVTIDHGDTSSISLSGGERVLVYDVQLKDATDRVFTLDVGTLTILEDVTQRVD